MIEDKTEPVLQTHICTGPLTGRVSACSGDSGGPLVKYQNGSNVQIGIVSYGIVPCGRKYAPTSVYTRVADFVIFIKEHIEL